MHLQNKIKGNRLKVWILDSESLRCGRIWGDGKRISYIVSQIGSHKLCEPKFVAFHAAKVNLRNKVNLPDHYGQDHGR